MDTPEFRSGIGLLRGFSRRCPLCGAGNVFRNWLETRDSCPGCGVRLDRGEDDFFLGAFTINLIAVELLLVGFLVGAVVLTWPEVPWDLLIWLGAPLMILMPVFFYPFSRTIWLALDLTLRPPEPRDFELPAEGEFDGSAGDGRTTGPGADTGTGPGFRRVS